MEKYGRTEHSTSADRLIRMNTDEMDVRLVRVGLGDETTQKADQLDLWSSPDQK